MYSRVPTSKGAGIMQERVFIIGGKIVGLLEFARVLIVGDQHRGGSNFAIQSSPAISNSYGK